MKKSDRYDDIVVYYILFAFIVVLFLLVPLTSLNEYDTLQDWLIIGTLLLGVIFTFIMVTYKWITSVVYLYSVNEDGITIKSHIKNSVILYSSIIKITVILNRTAPFGKWGLSNYKRYDCVTMIIETNSSKVKIFLLENTESYEILFKSIIENVSESKIKTINKDN